MSYAIAAPELMASAASELAGVESALRAAHAAAGSMTQLLAVAAAACIELGRLCASGNAQSGWREM
jgi:hypothetical protein